MKKCLILLSLAIVSLSSASYAQSISEDDFSGTTWTVSNTDLLPMPASVDEETKKAFQMMVDSFKGSEFVFQADKTFQLKIDENAPVVQAELVDLKPKQWNLNTSENLIQLSPVGKSNVVMTINVKFQSGKILFWVMDSPFLLYMEQKD
ncbi:MAG: hypothetical protein AAFQ98_24855 [Bacteroidota bacterium]